MAAARDDEARLEAGARAVVDRLRSAGHEALWAGGCVRDRVIGRAPKDYDIATSATPEVVMGLFEKSIPVGVQFGVVIAVVKGIEYEVATFRNDGQYIDGRRPTGVTWATAEEDVARRDFTINGLLYDPVDERLIDHVGGIEDLQAGVVRAIGVAADRFAEDHLRILRAVRFAARFGFEIEAQTWSAMVDQAIYIKKVSAERIHDEWTRILCEGGGAVGLELATRAGIAAATLPEIRRLDRAFRRFEGGVAPGETLTEALGWSLLMAEEITTPVAIRAFGKRLRWSNQLIQAVTQTLMAAATLGRWSDLGVAEKKRTARLAAFPDALVVGAAIAVTDEASSPDSGRDADGDGGMKSRTAPSPNEIQAARDEALDWDAAALNPPALISGRDLKDAGFPAGPRFKAALAAVEDAQLTGQVDTPEGALELAATVLTAP